MLVKTALAILDDFLLNSRYCLPCSQSVSVLPIGAYEVVVVALLAKCKRGRWRRRQRQKRVENKSMDPIGLVDTFLLEWPWANSVPLSLTRTCSRTSNTTHAKLNS